MSSNHHAQGGTAIYPFPPVYTEASLTAAGRSHQIGCVKEPDISSSDELILFVNFNKELFCVLKLRGVF